MCRFVCNLSEGLKEGFIEKSLNYIEDNLDTKLNEFKIKSMILDSCNYNSNKLLCEINKEEILHSIKEELVKIFNSFKNKKVEKGRELISIEVISNKVFHPNLEGEIKIEISNMQEGFYTSTGLVSMNLSVADNDILLERFKEELKIYNLSEEAKDYMLELFENSKTIFRDFDYLSDSLLRIIGDDTLNHLRNDYHYESINFNDVVCLIKNLYKNIYPYINISLKNNNGAKLFTIMLFNKEYKIEYFRAEYNVLKAV